MPIVAIRSGGDWADASVHHLVVPDEMDLSNEKSAYDKWYTEVFCADRPLVNYMNFWEWLVSRGARLTTDSEVLEFWDG